MKHIEDVCTALESVYNGLKTGDVDPRKAGEMSNALGKIIKGRASQLEYYALRKEAPSIPFWQEGPKAPEQPERTPSPGPWPADKTRVHRLKDD